MTKYHKLGVYQQLKLISHGPGSWEAKLKVQIISRAGSLQLSRGSLITVLPHGRRQEGIGVGEVSHSLTPLRSSLIPSVTAQPIA